MARASGAVAHEWAAIYQGPLERVAVVDGTGGETALGACWHPKCALGPNQSEAITASLWTNVNYLQGLSTVSAPMPDGPPPDGNFTLGAPLPSGPLRATTHLH